MSIPIPPNGPIENAGIPPYVPPYGPTPNITPFTYRDGKTYLQILEGLRVYINQTIVPFVDESIDDLENKWVEEVNRLIDAVNAAIDEVLNASIEVQDPVVAAIFRNDASETRSVTDLLYASKSIVDALVELTETGYLSEQELATTYALITDVQALSTYAHTEIDAIKNIINPPGRLSEEYLDDRYAAYVPPVVVPAVHAVILGSSNAQSGWGWTGPFCAAHGWVEHNYAVGGGGFQNPNDAGSFKSQALTAQADNSYDHTLVKYVFVIDMSNDIRGNTNVQTLSYDVFSILRTNYPSARIIMVPAVWTLVPDNIATIEIRVGNSKRYFEVMESSRAFNIEVIPYTWLWFWDSSNWVQGVPPNYHLNSAGYARLAWYIDQYLKGRSLDNFRPWTDATAVVDSSTMATNGWRTSRDGGIVSCAIQIGTYVGVPVDTTILRLPAGCAPMDKIAIELVGSDRNRYAFYVNYNGDVATLSALPGALTFWGSGSWKGI